MHAKRFEIAPQEIISKGVNNINIASPHFSGNEVFMRTFQMKKKHYLTVEQEVFETKIWNKLKNGPDLNKKSKNLLILKIPDFIYTQTNIIRKINFEIWCFYVAMNKKYLSNTFWCPDYVLRFLGTIRYIQDLIISKEYCSFFIVFFTQNTSLFLLLLIYEYLIL